METIKRKLLSVVIITCNREESLKKTILSCVEHIAMQWELIIIDNDSKDGTRKMVNDICEKKKVDVKYYYSKVNLGVAGARNLGFDMACGEVVYFIDDDATIVSKGFCIDDAYEYIMKKDGVSVLSTKIYDTLLEGYLEEIVEYKKKLEDGVNLRCFIGCSHFIKKKAISKVPLYPDNLFYGAEEIYLSYIIHAQGGKIEYYDKIEVFHEPSPNARTSEYEKMRNRILNWQIVKEYIYPFPFIILTEVIYWIRIFKLTHFNLIKLWEIHLLHKKRYLKKWEYKLTISQYRGLVELFGFRYLI